MANYANGKYQLTNPKKYTGNKAPHYRSEAITVPYRNPLTGKQTVYVPDFVVVYQDKKGRKIAEVIEIKPKSQTTLTEKTTKRDKLSVAINHAKWEAAAKWCKLKGLRFRVVTEDDIFHKGKKRG